MNAGIFGGTFDPVHNGHLRVAEEARAQFNLTEVIFVPAGHPWMKYRSITPARHRVQMLRLAIAPCPHFRLSSMEIERAGLTYTIDTIEQLHVERPQDDLYFILGWDSLAQLTRWRDAPRLIKMCYLIAAPRPGYAMPDLKLLEGSLPGISQRGFVMDKPHVDISATEIRERVARGLSIRRLVPEAVEKYIKQHGIYAAKT